MNTRLVELMHNLTNANGRLQESLSLEPTRIHKDASIQRFEFTIELAWKTMQEAVRFMGEDAASPREAVRVSARINLVQNPELWLSLLTARNLTAHVYKEDVADMVYEEAKKLPPLVSDLLTRISTAVSTS